VNRIRRVGAAIVAVVAMLTLAACGTLSNPSSDQLAINYSAGSYEAQKFLDCQDPSTRERKGIGDRVYYYPAGQRTFKFSNDEGSDNGPLTVSTKNAELTVSGTVTFTLTIPCDKFTDKAGKTWDGGLRQKFHETIGRKDSAFTEKSDEQPGNGWDTMIRTYVKDVVDRAVDNEALGYSWQDLYSNPEKKTAWETAVVASIPRLIETQTGEKFFTVNAILIQKPTIPDALKREIENGEAATLRANNADIDKGAAANWPGGVAAYIEYQRQLAVNKAIESGQVKVIPIPQGSPILIQVPQ